MTITGTRKRLLSGLAAVTTAGAVLFAPVAASASTAQHTAVVQTQTTTLPAAAKYAAWLKPNQTLRSGQILVSANGGYKLLMQSDGNLVFYKKVGKQFVALWSTNTKGNAGARAVMQSDGNLVVYKSKRALWSTRTNGYKVKGLAVQNDGNLVIYRTSNAPIWHRFIIVAIPPQNTLIKAGISVVSYNRAYRLTMQSDGNLVLYKGNKALWSSRTTVKGSYAVSQIDGNFVIYHGKKAIWSTKTQGHKGAYLAVQNDGNVVVYGKSGKAIWWTGTKG